MTNKVTIVIPTFNRAHLVCDTIDSALAQTEPCDIIVCDHGSRDNTPQVVRKYGDRITYIRRERDFGPHFCWLEGILNANTDLVHIHYDDDLMDPHFIEETLRYMQDDVGMVFTDACMIDRTTGKTTIPEIFQFSKTLETGIMPSRNLEKMLLDGLMLSPAICLYRRRDVIDAILPGNLPINFGGAYHGVGPDLLMSLLVCLRYPKCAVITRPLARFGTHAGSITIDAAHDPAKQHALTDGYNAFRTYYRLIKLYQTNPLVRYATFVCSSYKRWNKRLERRVKLFLKAIGLRRKEVQ